MPAPAPLRDRADACPGVFAPHDAADGPLARVRLPGGAVEAAALRVVAGCADELGDGRVHLTSRGNLQLRAVSRIPEFVARLTAAGLLPSATHERVRNILASPLAGDLVPRVRGAAGTTLDARGTRSCDVRGLAAALDRELCARPGLAALPGRFLFALDDGRGDVAAEEPDLCWQAPDRLLVAGADTGLRVAAGDAVAALLAAAEAFLALRAADGGTAWRAAELRAADGGTAWRAAELPDAPARIGAALAARFRLRPDASRVAPLSLNASGGTLLAPRRPPEAAVPGPVRRADGGLALVVAPLLGALTADQVRLLADAAPGVVVTPWRTVVLPEPHLDAHALAAAGLLTAPGPAADLSACAGRPGCAKALADVRADAVAALGRRSDGGRPAGRVHVSGCPRRCGAPRGPHVDAVAQDGGGYLVDGVLPSRAGAVIHEYVRDGAEIYRRSFATIRAEADLSRLPPDVAAVAVRMIHACGQVDLVDDLGFSPGVVTAARTALRRGAPILCDAGMVAAGVTRARLPAGNDVVCTLRDPRVPALADRLGTTRSAAALELWRDRLDGAVVAVGNAPTALFHLLDLLDAGAPRPAAVVGIPVGFVGAAESKDALTRTDLEHLVVHGRRGGSAITAAALNALACEEEILG